LSLTPVARFAGLPATARTGDTTPLDKAWPTTRGDNLFALRANLGFMD